VLAQSRGSFIHPTGLAFVDRGRVHSKSGVCVSRTEEEQRLEAGWGQNLLFRSGTLMVLIGICLHAQAMGQALIGICLHAQAMGLDPGSIW
jgi:hypothetical protein